ncbi:MAG: hypothetical protein ACLFTJ_04825, partial [Halothece sp.]
NHQAESGSILLPSSDRDGLPSSDRDGLPSSDRDGRITENNWNNYSATHQPIVRLGGIKGG